ncbi:MAG TPA: hypothetical protein VEF05_15180 [Terriglobales bacterium]|nr:hypothetical protein [Terriglobales bacterium]
MNNQVSRRDFIRLSLGGITALTVASQGASTSPETSPKSTISVHLRLARYADNELIDDCTLPLLHDESHSFSLDFAGARWVCDGNASKVPDRPDAVDFSLRFQVVQGAPRNHSVGVRLIVDPWSTDNYVLIPAALYNGNRFESRHLDYPPLLTDPNDIGPNVPTIITDVPRLNIAAGPSRVQLIAGDMSTPAMGFYAPNTEQGFWLLTDQKTRLGDTGLGLEESLDRKQAYLSLTAPHVREKYKYRICTTRQPSDDRAWDFHPGDGVRLRFRIYSFPCPKIQALFDRFVEIRKDLSGEVKLCHQLPFSAAWKIQEEKYKSNWVEPYGYYSVGMRDNMYEDWQPGWTGGLMVTYPLLIAGNQTSRARALRNFDFVFPAGTGPSGYLRAVEYEGKWYSDGFEKPHATKWVMSRKSADVLYFMLKQLMLLEKHGQKASPAWVEGTRRLADAFVKTWNKFGQFGQFVDIDTGDVLVGGSTAAGIAPAGLALASGYFQRPEYMRLATASADYFYQRYVSRGLSTGGPGEICQCPDSESSFGLLESFVVLYEVSGNPKWLQYAAEMAHQCATWMVSYDFEFPPQSLFGRLNMHSAGAVFANAQNKHGAPGICTLSGNSLFKLYRYTGRKLYLDLIQELAHNLTQYLSRSDRPVGHMPAGWMNERVQLSDWLEPIGEIFEGSTWPEVSNMLTWVEVPGLYVQPDSAFFCAIDHIDVSVGEKKGKSLTLDITNPTRFDASVKVLCELSTEARRILGQNYLVDCPQITLRASSTRRVTFPLQQTV